MVDEAGMTPFGPPSPTQRKVDLRDVRTVDGRSAYEVYQELVGHPPRGPSLKETVGRIIQTPAYQRAPEGDADQRGTKQGMLAGTVSKYREMGMKLLMRDPNVRQAVAMREAQGRAASVAKESPKTDRQTGAEILERLGKATGVDLGGVLPVR